MRENGQKIAMLTGGTGQDASFLAEFLLRKGYFVVSLKRRTSVINTSRVDHLYHDPNFKLEYFDLNDAGSMYQLLSRYMPDEIYLLAAQSHVHTSFAIPEHTVDGIAMGTLRFLNAIKLITPTARVYNSASSELFGINQKMPLNEESEMIAASPYACAKKFAFDICRNYRSSYGMHISSGILFNHGSERRGETFIERKLSMAVSQIKMGLRDDLRLGNLKAKRDIGYAKEYVECMYNMLQQEVPDDYCIATGETHSVEEMCSFLFDYAGLGDYKKYVTVDERLYRPQEVPILLGDSSKAEKILGWRAKTKIFDLLKLMYENDLKLVKQQILQGEAKWKK